MVSILAKFLGGRALKAVSSAAGGALLGSDLLRVFMDGVVGGVEPQINTAGMIVGGMLGSVLQYLLTYLPRNRS